MFEIFKKSYRLLSPVDGKVMNLSEVPDKIFAEKLVGDGVAIQSLSNIVVAPCDGILNLIFRTNNAFSLKLKSGIEILVHVGINTVELEGEGFERIVPEGDFVKAGTPILKMDREKILKKGYSLIIPVLIINPDNIKELKYYWGTDVKTGKDVIFEYKLK